MSCRMWVRTARRRTAFSASSVLAQASTCAAATRISESLAVSGAGSLSLRRTAVYFPAGGPVPNSRADQGAVQRRQMGTLQMVASLAVGLPVGLYAWKAVFAVATQNNMIYARHSRMIEPERGRRDVSPPESAGFVAAQYRELELTTSDKVKLHAWIFLQPEAQRRDAPTLIYLQGNAFDIGHRLPVFRMLMERTDANVLALSYRGYGKSRGSPSERGLRLDALAAFAWLRSPAAAALGLATPPNHRIFLYGHSLGGAVALALAFDLKKQHLQHNASSQLAGIIVENSFTSLAEMVDEIFPNWTVYPHITGALASRWESLSTIASLPTDLPVLFLSGASDHEVPPDMMKKLYEASVAKQKLWISVAGGGHNDTWKKGASMDAIAKFVRVES